MIYGDIPLFLIAFGGLIFLLATIIRPIIGLYSLLLVLGLLDYKSILEQRLAFSGIPINLIEITCIALLPALSIIFVKNLTTSNHLVKSYFGLILLIIGTYLTIELIRAVFLKEDIYEACRVIVRNYLLITFAYLYARLSISSLTSFKSAVFVIFFTGLYSMIGFIVERLLAIGTVTDYLSIAGVGSGGSSNDFVLIFVWSSIIYGYHIVRSKLVMYGLFFISCFYYIISFRLTAFYTPLIIISTGTLLANIPLSRKIVLIKIAVTVVVIFLLFYYAILPRGELLSRIISLMDEPSKQIFSLSTSDHYLNRILSWEEALAKLRGMDYFFGMGLGYFEFIDTGLSTGIVLLGEPAYSTYLLKIGFIGLLLFVILQINFAILAHREMMAGNNLFIKITMLSLLIWGITNIIYCTAHNNFIYPLVSCLFGVFLGLVDAGKDLNKQNIDCQKFKGGLIHMIRGPHSHVMLT